MTYENIIVTTKTAIGTLTINRPTKLNALNKATIEELHHAFNVLELNEDVKVIILTGTGEKAFVAGADISEFANFSPEQGYELAAEGQSKKAGYSCNQWFCTWWRTGIGHELSF
jgi:enoyl-CoA hydratase